MYAIRSYYVTLLTVTPVTAEAVKQEPRYNNISDYNQGLKELAEKENIGFVDLSPLFTSGSDALYDSDGIHFKPEYYTKLLDLLKDQVNRITSYNVCYTKLLRVVVNFLSNAIRYTPEQDRITSYNVCYTKLLRRMQRIRFTIQWSYFNSRR